MREISIGRQISGFVTSQAAFSTAELVFLIPYLSPCAITLAEGAVEALHGVQESGGPKIMQII